MVSTDAAPEVREGELVLALDQGGHASRAIVFDARGEVRARELVEVGERRAGADRVEQEPRELVRSLERAIEGALARVAPGERVVRAGLATQRSSAVCWDRRGGRALTPVLSWQDRRAAAWLARFDGRAEDVRARTGLRLSPHYGASKLRWCLDHVEAVREAAARDRLALGPVASFLAFRLCRERPLVADPANAQRTQLYSIAAFDWDPELCDLFGVPADALPRCVRTRETFGSIAAGERSIPLAVLTGDQSAAIFAGGEPRGDTAYVNLGTGAFVQRPIDGAPPDVPRLLTSLAARLGDRATSVVEGTVNGAGSALAAFAQGLGEPGFENELGRALEEVREPPLFLNGVSGLGAPYWMPAFRTRFVGEGDRLARLAAVGESIAFLIASILDEMRAALGPPARIVASGGLSEVEPLCRRIADLARAPVERVEEREGTARGLATLLGVRAAAAGAATVHEPRRDAGLERRYARFREEVEREIR